MSLSISQAKCGAPGEADGDPANDTEHHAQPLNIGDQMSGCVSVEAGVGTTRQRPAAPRPALVEEYGAIKARIEEAPLTCRAARARTTVQKKCRGAHRISAALPINFMPVAHVEQTTVVGFYSGELHRHIRAPCFQVRSNLHGGSSACGPLLTKSERLHVSALGES
jgi:hypothetical protein